MGGPAVAGGVARRRGRCSSSRWCPGPPLLAEYLRDGEQSSAAAVTYGLVMSAMAGSFTLIWVRLMRADDLTHPELRARIPVAVRRSLVGPAVYLVGTGIAFISALAAFALFAFAALFFAVSDRAARGGAGSEAPARAAARAGRGGSAP
jgi:hypothetical protein